MRKLFLTLVFGLFFVAFSNAQSATVTGVAKMNERAQELLTKRIDNNEKRFRASNKLALKDTINRPKHTVQLDVWGNYSILSINYDKIVVEKEKYFLARGIGLGINGSFEFCPFGQCSSLITFLTIPHYFTTNYNLSSNKHYIEFGVGGTLLISSEFTYGVYPLLGYRYQALNNNGLNFRIFGSLPIPVLGQQKQLPLGVPLGLSLGISFE